MPAMWKMTDGASHGRGPTSLCRLQSITLMRLNRSSGHDVGAAGKCHTPRRAVECVCMSSAAPEGGGEIRAVELRDDLPLEAHGGGRPRSRHLRENRRSEACAEPERERGELGRRARRSRPPGLPAMPSELVPGARSTPASGDTRTHPRHRAPRREPSLARVPTPFRGPPLDGGPPAACVMRMQRRTTSGPLPTRFWKRLTVQVGPSGCRSRTRIFVSRLRSLGRRSVRLLQVVSARGQRREASKFMSARP